MSEIPKPLRSLVAEWRKLLKNPPIPLSSYDAGRLHKTDDCAKALETALDQWEAWIKADNGVFIATWVRQHILGPRGET